MLLGNVGDLLRESHPLTERVDYIIDDRNRYMDRGLVLKHTVARLVSIVWHPLALLALLGIVVTAHRLPTGSPLVIAALLAVGSLPLIWLTERRVRTGRWATRDASQRPERRTLYGVALATITGLLGYALIMGPEFLVPGLVSLAALLVAGLVLLRWMSMSLHMAAATYVAFALGSEAPWAGILLGFSLPLLAWARLVLGKHTPTEVLVGAVLGALAGTAAVIATG